jgi:hypothetical protein
MTPPPPIRRRIRSLELALPIGLTALAFIVSSVIASSAVEADGGRRAHWQPRPTTKPWQWQLQGRIDTSVDVPVFDVDGLETQQRTVRKLHDLHARVICHLDVSGFREPTQALERRFEICERKGFDAVEPDGLTGRGNLTGLRTGRQAQLRFSRWVADQVHRRGMAAGLKNGGRLARALVGDFDFAIVERCFQFHECGYYRPFVRHRKAVFEAEYELKVGEYCATARKFHFSSIGKSRELFARPWRPC